MPKEQHTHQEDVHYLNEDDKHKPVMSDKQIQKEKRARFYQEAVPFETAQEAWFWFIQAQEAKADGARITAGQGLVGRPCEPSDILKVLDRLYRNRILKWDHCLVLRHYGRKQMAPDERYVKERKAAHLWKEAMTHLYPILLRKNIIKDKEGDDFSFDKLSHDAALFEASKNQNNFDGRL